MSLVSPRIVQAWLNRQRWLFLARPQHTPTIALTIFKYLIIWMKKDNSSSELNSFHLQLYALEQEESNISKGQELEQDEWLYKIDYFPISISLASSVVYFSLFALWVISLFDAYLYAYGIVFSQPSAPLIHTITGLLFSNAILGYVVNSLLVVIIAISFSFHYLEASEGIFYFCWYFSSKTYEYLRYFIEVLFFSASYYAFNADIPSLLIFALASLISCFATIFLQNITLRKDEFCVKSLEFSFLFRVSLIVSFVLNIITVNQVYALSQLIGCIIGQITVSTTLVICYYSFGLVIYRHDVARYSTLLLIIIYFALSTSFLVDALATLSYSYPSSNVFLISIVSVIFSAFFFLSTLDRIRRKSNMPTNKNLKSKVYFSFNKFEHADEDQELDCQIRGILHHHYTRGCKNMECIANIQEVYDSKKKKKCYISKIAQGKASLVKFYIKCLYDSALGESEHDKNLKIDFIEFNYLKLKNVFTTLRMIVQLQMGYLNFYQKMRVVRIKDHLIEESNKFSRELYNQSISSCKIIAAEQTFTKIQRLIQIFILRNELFWKYLSFNEVHLKEIIKIVQPNFKLMEAIGLQWAKINHFFPINRRWKFYYICFTIFVKNQKIKPSMIEDFGNSVEYDSIFKTDNYFVDKTTEKDLLYNPIMLFQQNTCYVHTRCDQDKMVVTKVSKFFERNFEYEPNEIINSTINMLMPPSIVKFHHPLFLSWIKEGRSNNQAFYEIKKIYPLTKRGFIYPCFKFYKRFIQTSGQMEFIAMLKSNRQDEQMILLNGDFEIEGITFSLHQKFKFTSEDYFYLKGINILALMPMLVKYTKYCCMITEKDEDFLEHDDNKNYFKKQSTLIKGKLYDQIDNTNILHERKSLNLANTKLYLPNDLQGVLDHYKHLMHAKKMEVFDAIRELYRWIRKDKNYSKYKTEISIRQKSIMNNVYYEVQINELQENNRLQKLKMSELQSEHANSMESTNRQIEENRLNEIDMQLFLSMSKKRNKVVLFPSKNIFIKDENNKALTEIAHINNINIFVRISLLIFLSLVLVQMFIEVSMSTVFNQLTNYYYEISRYDKLTFVLNTQYNIQHIQPGNSWEESFYIIAYTHMIIDSFNSSYFQALLYHKELNTANLYPPYQLITPSNLTASRSQQTLDQFSIFFKMYECIIAVHRTAQNYPQDTLDTQQYYELNNYIYSFRKKAEDIRMRIQESFDSHYSYLRGMNIVFGVVITVIVVGCLIFSVSRLWKVSNGFKELASILIQIDNNDLRDVIKYVDYTKYLFEHLNQKNQRMELQNETQYSSTSGNFRSFQKKSSELTEQQQKFANSSANLNKKIKKIWIGQQITKMICKSAVILLSTATLIGFIMVSLNIYSVISLDAYKQYKQIGFNFMDNSGINNIVASGAIQKYRSSNIYEYSKYSSFIQKSMAIQSSNNDIKYTLGASKIQKKLKTLYFQNFCEAYSSIINDTLSHTFDQICDITNAGWCSYIYETLSQSKLVERCRNIQNGQLAKGLYNYNNFFLKQVSPFFKDISNLTLLNIVEINDAYKLVDIFVFKFMKLWSTEAEEFSQQRKSNIVLIVVCVFLSTIILNIIFIEYMMKTHLTEKYQIFRLIHEHYIPEWIIIKQKIIKVKLIKEGFMKE